MLADILLKTNKLIPVHKAVNKENVKRFALFDIFICILRVYLIYNTHIMSDLHLYN